METKPTITPEEWLSTPESVRRVFERLEEQNRSLVEQNRSLVEQNRRLEARIVELEAQVEKLQARLDMNSQNSSKPPSSDPPFTKPGPDGGEKKKPGGKKGHKGHRQKFLEPTETVVVRPVRCSCGNTDFSHSTPYYTHQVVELPEIRMDVTHFVLHKAVCPVCGKRHKAVVPPEHNTGFGPRLSAFIVELIGMHGNSRSAVQSILKSVLGVHICLGAVQKVADRASRAMKPHYEAIAEITRRAPVAHVDETSHPENKAHMWVWLMATQLSALFMIHEKRSKAAFRELVGDWQGILVSDGYGLYRKWEGLRQACNSHLIRDARGLSERPDPETARFGKWAKEELQRLCHMSHAPPTMGEWRMWKARFSRLIGRNRDRKDDTGKFARRLAREGDALWLFISEDGVPPTNNHAERTFRFLVLWRKLSQGTRGEKGRRFVERSCTLRQTCRLNAKPTYPVLVDAMASSFMGNSPELGWIWNIGMTTL
jgi:transposase